MESSQHNRRLAAILFTDIVGYTAMMQQDETLAVIAINRHQEVLEDRVASHEGEVMQYYGDGSLSIFKSASEAVRCAMEIQVQLQREPQVPLRIGIHIGEIFFDNGKVMGDGVNVASRIESIGVAGAVLFSREVYSKIRNRSEFTIEPMGNFEFKNVDEPVGVFAIANDGFFVPEQERFSAKVKTPSRQESTEVIWSPFFIRKKVPLLLGLFLIGGLVGWFIQKNIHAANKAEKTVKRMVIPLQEAPASMVRATDFSHGQRAFDISPDGNTIVYVAKTSKGAQLALRPFDSYAIRLLSGTEDAYYPFFSPDGLWVGYFADSKLFKVAIDGMTQPVFIAEVTDPYGAIWREGGDIIYVDREGGKLAVVSTVQNNPRPSYLQIKEDYFKFLWPSPLPDPNYLLLSSDQNEIFAVDLISGNITPIFQGGSNPTFVSSGFLVFVQLGRLMAVRFDAEKLQIHGTAVPVLDHLRIEGGENCGQYVLSGNGTLLYASGSPVDKGSLVFVDRKGRELHSLSLPADYYMPFFISPNGKFLSYQVQDRAFQERGKQKIYVYDLDREVSTLFEKEGIKGIWSPDGKSLTYTTKLRDHWAIIDKSMNGKVVDTLLVSHNLIFPTVWSNDKKIMIFSEVHPNTLLNMMFLDLSNSKKVPKAISNLFANETFASLSPNEDYVVYESDESSGRSEIFVQPFPPTGEKTQISREGGHQPFWLANGSEIIYRSKDYEKMMVVSVDWSKGFKPRSPRVLWKGSYLDIPGWSYDITPDGQSFLMIKSGENKHTRTELYVVENWVEELNLLVPSNR